MLHRRGPAGVCGVASAQTSEASGGGVQARVIGRLISQVQVPMCEDAINDKLCV